MMLKRRAKPPSHPIPTHPGPSRPEEEREPDPPPVQPQASPPPDHPPAPEAPSGVHPTAPRLAADPLGDPFVASAWAEGVRAGSGGRAVVDPRQNDLRRLIAAEEARGRAATLAERCDRMRGLGRRFGEERAGKPLTPLAFQDWVTTIEPDAPRQQSEDPARSRRAPKPPVAPGSLARLAAGMAAALAPPAVTPDAEDPPKEASGG